MRVFVWTGGHTIAESLVQSPPEGVCVISNIQSYTKRTGISGERMFAIPDDAKRVLDGLVFRAGIPRFLPFAPKADIIHTVSGLVPLAPRPWVTTISLPSSFFGLNDECYDSRRRLWLLSKILRTDSCKRITCFSKSTLDGIRHVLHPYQSKKIEPKLEVLYPAIDPTRFVQRKKKNGNEFRILFVGNHFFDKGGRELHRAVSRLARKYDVHLDLVTNAPPHHDLALKEYVRKHQEDWVSWHIPGLKRKQLIEEFYPTADVFVMCSYMEVFGFVFIEAMACGLPVIGANIYAQREIISDEDNGYLIDVPVSPFEGDPQLRTTRSITRYRNAILNESIFDSVVDQLAEKLRLLIENGNVREQMSRTARKMTTDGRFSLTTRNKRLKEIYEDALE